MGRHWSASVSFRYPCQSMGNSTAAAFGSRSTAMQVLQGRDLSGRTYVITGANTGIGKETAHALVSAGATVVLGCRNIEKAERAIRDIREATNCDEGSLRNIRLDTSDLDSVREFARALDQQGIQKVHCLVNNAGIMALPQYTTNDAGIELQWATNHLGHFALTKLLLPKLKAAAPSRVVNVASVAHEMAPSPMTPEQFPPAAATYGEWSNYGISKFSNILHAKQLQRLYGDAGVTAVSLHPGVIKTELHRNNTGASIMYNLGNLFMKSIGQGASTQTMCAVCDVIVGGAYYADCAIKEPRNDANSEALAESLWERSDALIGGE